MSHSPRFLRVREMFAIIGKVSSPTSTPIPATEAAFETLSLANRAPKPGRAVYCCRLTTFGHDIRSSFRRTDTIPIWFAATVLPGAHSAFAAGRSPILSSSCCRAGTVWARGAAFERSGMHRSQATRILDHLDREGLIDRDRFGILVWIRHGLVTFNPHSCSKLKICRTSVSDPVNSPLVVVRLFSDCFINPSRVESNVVAAPRCGGSARSQRGHSDHELPSRTECRRRFGSSKRTAVFGTDLYARLRDIHRRRFHFLSETGAHPSRATGGALCHVPSMVPWTGYDFSQRTGERETTVLAVRPVETLTEIDPALEYPVHASVCSSILRARFRLLSARDLQQIAAHGRG